MSVSGDELRGKVERTNMETTDLMPCVGFGAFLVVLFLNYVCRSAFSLALKRMLDDCPKASGEGDRHVVTTQVLDAFCRATTSLILLKILTNTASVLAVLVFGKVFAPEVMRKGLADSIGCGPRDARNYAAFRAVSGLSPW